MRLKTVFLSVLFGVTSFLLQAQGVSQQYLNYIERYKGMAIDQMLRYKIPASITLAQGLLESGAGTSTLARKANNHFGIKCGRAWKGPYVLQDDDERNEKFRNTGAWKSRTKTIHVFCNKHVILRCSTFLRKIIKVGRVV